MDSHELKQLLELVRDGRVQPAEAAQQILIHPFQDAGGFAKVDFTGRCGVDFPRSSSARGRRRAQIEAILKTLVAAQARGTGDAARSAGSRPFDDGLSRAVSITRSAGRSGFAAPRGRAEAGPGRDRDGGHERLAGG